MKVISRGDASRRSPLPCDAFRDLSDRDGADVQLLRLNTGNPFDDRWASARLPELGDDICIDEKAAGEGGVEAVGLLGHVGHAPPRQTRDTRVLLVYVKWMTEDVPRIVRTPIPFSEVTAAAQRRFGDMVKAAVDQHLPRRDRGCADHPMTTPSEVHQIHHPALGGDGGPCP